MSTYLSAGQLEHVFLKLLLRCAILFSRGRHTFGVNVLIFGSMSGRSVPFRAVGVGNRQSATTNNKIGKNRQENDKIEKGRRQTGRRVKNQGSFTLALLTGAW